MSYFLRTDQSANHEALFPAGTGEVVDSTTATTTSVTWGATDATSAATNAAAME